MAEVTKDLLEQVTKELNAVSDKFTRQAETAMAEMKNLGQVTENTKRVADSLTEQHGKLAAQQKAIQAQLDEVEQKSVRRGGAPENGVRSIGYQVIESEQIKGLNSHIGRNTGVSIPVKNTTTSTGFIPTSAPPALQPHVAPMVPRLKQRLFVRDLITPGRATLPAIFWLQQTGFTNAAEPVSEGSAKPYSDITFTTKITGVKTLAHMFKASKQILDDFAQLQSLVDLEMRYGLKYVEEQQILFGDGSGINLHGIIPQATPYAHEFTVPLMNSIDDIRLAVLQSQLARIPASGIVMHYVDWARIETLKDSTGRYLIGDPHSTLPNSLWGLPVVPTELTAMRGKFLTGPFDGGAQIFDREDANVVISTENADDFEKNLISIRAEERLALAVYRPEGFIYGSMTVST